MRNLFFYNYSEFKGTDLLYIKKFTINFAVKNFTHFQVENKLVINTWELLIYFSIPIFKAHTKKKQAGEGETKKENRESKEGREKEKEGEM